MIFKASVIGFVGGILGALSAWGDEIANKMAYRYVLKAQVVAYIDFFVLPPYLWCGALLLAVLVLVPAVLQALRHD